MPDTLQYVTQASDAKHAMQLLASALDRIESKLDALSRNWQMSQAEPPKDTWVQPWDNHDAHMKVQEEWERNEREGGVTVTQTEDSTDINFAPVSKEWRISRGALARQAQLDEQIGEGMAVAYVKGGPLWLYHGGSEGRDYILGLPEHMRREMVADLVANASQQDAEEFARDVLKVPTDQQQGAAAKISEENILNQRRS
jgi:hypothetical protein